MNLGDKIKLIRKTIRMSQREFSKELRCSQPLISAYELGTKKPSYDLLVALGEVAKKYKVKVKLL